MTQKKSPWAQVSDTASQQNDPAPLPLSDQKENWHREEFTKLFTFLDSERHITLQHAADNYIPQFANQVAAFKFWAAHATYFDDLQHGLIQLGEGGAPDHVLSSALGLDADKADTLTFFSAEMDELMELECAKEAATDDVTYKTATLRQALIIFEAYKDNLHGEERGSAISDAIIDRMTQYISGRIDSKLTFDLPVAEKQSIAHWPGVAALSKVMMDIGNLGMQAKAASFQMEHQKAQLSYQDDTLESAQTYSDSIDAFCEALSRNIQIHLQSEVYFLPLAGMIQGLQDSLGEQAHDTDTPWTLDENFIMQLKIQELTQDILRQLRDDEEAQNDPEFLVAIHKAAQEVCQQIEDSYPLDEALKPAFWRAQDQKAKESLLREGGEAATLSQQPHTARNKGPAPKA